MSKDKYLSIFSPQMETIVFIILQIFFAMRTVWKIGECSQILPSFSWGIFGHVTCLDQSHASENIRWFIFTIIIHQTHYQKSDWSRAFNQFTIACELDMINAISAADIVFIMLSSTSAWLLSPLECSPQKQNG